MSVQDIHNYLWLCFYTVNWISEDILASRKIIKLKKNTPTWFDQQNWSQQNRLGQTTLWINKICGFLNLIICNSLIPLKNNAFCENVPSHTHTRENTFWVVNCRGADRRVHLCTPAAAASILLNSDWEENVTEDVQLNMKSVQQQMGLEG